RGRRRLGQPQGLWGPVPAPERLPDRRGPLIPSSRRRRGSPTSPAATGGRTRLRPPLFSCSPCGLRGFAQGEPMSHSPDLALENPPRVGGFRRVAGVDAVGRGPVSWPVVAAAERLKPAKVPARLNDSKKLTASRRTSLFEEIRAVADVSIAEASVGEIDARN